MTIKKLNIKMKILLDCQKKINFIEKSLSAISPDHKIIVVEESVYSSNLFMIRDMKGLAQASECYVLTTLCSILEDHIPFLVNLDSMVDEDTYCKLFILIKLIKEYVTLNLTDAYDEEKFKSDYKDMIFLKDQEIEQSPLMLNKSELRVLFVAFPNSIIKKVGNELKDVKNMKIATSRTVEESLYRIKNEVFDVVVSSYNMDPMDGLAFSATLKQQYKKNAPFFILNPSDVVSLEDMPQMYQPEKVILRDEQFYNNLKNSIKDVQNVKMNFIASNRNKVLFIDDNEFIIETYRMLCLAKETIVPFFNYGNDIDLNVIEKIAPNLIVCDVCMPDIDVRDLLKGIKSHPQLCTVPVIFITGNNSMPICKELTELGATAILEKSFLKNTFFDDLISVKVKF